MDSKSHFWFKGVNSYLDVFEFSCESIFSAKTRNTSKERMEPLIARPDRGGCKILLPSFALFDSLNPVARVEHFGNIHETEWRVRLQRKLHSASSSYAVSLHTFDTSVA